MIINPYESVPQPRKFSPPVCVPSKMEEPSALAECCPGETTFKEYGLDFLKQLLDVSQRKKAEAIIFYDASTHELAPEFGTAQGVQRPFNATSKFAVIHTHPAPAAEKIPLAVHSQEDIVGLVIYSMSQNEEVASIILDATCPGMSGMSAIAVSGSTVYVENPRESYWIESQLTNGIDPLMHSYTQFRELMAKRGIERFSVKVDRAFVRRIVHKTNDELKLNADKQSRMLDYFLKNESAQ